MEKSYKELLKDITTFVFDVDGVFTNGSLFVDTEGEMLRTMNVKDGYALKIALDKGYKACIISGGTNEGVRKRFSGLGVQSIYLGAFQKVQPLNEFLSTNNIALKNVLYMGDDLPDIAPLKLVGLPTCPQDAAPEVKEVCTYISHRNGGEQCVRDVIRQVLKVRGDWYENFDAKNA